MKYLHLAVHPTDQSQLRDKPPAPSHLEMVHERRYKVYQFGDKGVVQKAVVTQGGDAGKREYSVSWSTVTGDEAVKAAAVRDELMGKTPAKDAEPAKTEEVKK